MALPNLENRAILDREVYENSVRSGSPYAMAQQRGYPVQPSTASATERYFAEAQPIERLFNPQQYLTDMTQFETSLQGDRKKLRGIASALKLMNPNFDPSSYLNNWETQARASQKRRYDLIEDVDKKSVDYQIEKIMQEQKPQTEQEFQQLWDTFGIYNSETRNKHFDLWRKVNPEVDTALLTSDVFTKESRTAYKRSRNVADLMIDEKLDLRGYKTRAELRGIETKYRDEFIKESKVFSGLVDNYGRLLAAADQDTGAGDLALIFNFMKLNDPGSTVREGEFATAEQAPGTTARVLNLYNKVKDGTRLRPQDRLQFLETGDAMFKQKQAVQQRLIEQYTGLAQRANVDPAQVIIRYAPRITENGQDYLKIGTYLVPIEDVAQIVDFEKMKGKEWEDEEDDTGILPMPGSAGKID